MKRVYSKDIHLYLYPKYAHSAQTWNVCIEYTRKTYMVFAHHVKDTTCNSGANHPNWHGHTECTQIPAYTMYKDTTQIQNTQKQHGHMGIHVEYIQDHLLLFARKIHTNSVYTPNTSIILGTQNTAYIPKKLHKNTHLKYTEIHSFASISINRHKQKIRFNHISVACISPPQYPSRNLFH